MCCLFGLIDYGHTLTPKQKNHLLAVLSTFCEVRGTDATGIAYHSHGRLCIYKRPIPAHQMHFRIRHLRFQIGKSIKIPMLCGEILQVSATGHIVREQFDDSRLFSPYVDPRWQRFFPPWEKQPIVTSDSLYLNELKSVAPAFGYTPEQIDALAAEGFSPEELEDFLYCGEI